MSSARAGRAFRIAGVVCAVGLQPTCAEPPRTDVADPARRIVSLVPAATEILVSIGCVDRLVGRAADDPTPGAEGVPIVGTVLAPGLERVAAVAPDLILVPPEFPIGELGSLARVEVLRVGRRVAAMARRLAELLHPDIHLAPEGNLP